MVDIGNITVFCSSTIWLFPGTTSVHLTGAVILKVFTSKLYPIIDLSLTVLIYPAALLLKFIRKFGIHKLPACKRVLLYVGIFPIRNHYYEPQFDYRQSKTPFGENRNLPGIAWNVDQQISYLENLKYSAELQDCSTGSTNFSEFSFGNGKFESGDAEYWYQIIRHTRPRKIYEVGSGHSTLMAIKAIQMNLRDNPDYTCKHVCIEPYEMPWLEEAPVEVIRQKIENLDINLFLDLEEDDILFIDSSHIIRPQGDVLREYLEILPVLNKGVIVHIHDIFSPKNYPDLWLNERVKFWNEQYLLEAFLTHNSSWTVLGALNYLHHNHYKKLKLVAPFLKPDREPGSFYIRKCNNFEPGALLESPEF